MLVGRSFRMCLAILAVLGPLLVAEDLAPQGSAAAGTPRPVQPLSRTGISGWSPAGSYDENSVYAGEGVVTVTPPGGTPYELYRGLGSVPASLKAQGWAHIGDPDSVRGYLVDAYQGPSSGTSKMFLVTTPSGQSIEYVHTLVRGELYNNSFVAIAPNAQWMVSGEWGTMSHLLIYPTPLLNHKTHPNGGALDLAGYIKLDHQVYDIQGCAFVSAMTLICASDDETKSLFANDMPLLQVDLTQPLHGHSVTGHVEDLGSIPEESSCSGTFEPEGVDFDASTRILRVEIIQPGSCILKTTVYQYRPDSAHG